MLNKLKDCEPLSQVVFIHDYIQLILQDCTINVYNKSEITPKDSPTIKHGDTGYADALEMLINSTITNVQIKTGVSFSLLFSNGSEFNILLDPESSQGPEAFMVSGKPLEGDVIEQNA